MNIGLLAMSGIRAHDPELLRLGLTLPGFVERSKAVASLPSLGLLYLAAVTPPGHHVQYFEAESDRTEPPEIYNCDLVAISTFSAQVFEAYAIADRLRAKGIKVALGGLHVTTQPTEAAAHADYLILGEGEPAWPHLVTHFASDTDWRNQLKSQETSSRVTGVSPVPAQPQSALAETSRFVPVPLNVQSGHAQIAVGHCPPTFQINNTLVFDTRQTPVDISTLPTPRYDLIAGRPYNRFTVQTSRGCPWRCDFCASSVMLQQKYRKRPIPHILRDIHSLRTIRTRPFIEFADDNTFVDKAWGKQLCQALIPEKLKWFAETDITVADDSELLTLMRQSGCREILIGLESPAQGDLQGLELHANAKHKWASTYADRITRIQSHGIAVNACFILGLDTHSPAIFDDVAHFAETVKPFDIQITVLTPFPGTPLYERLKKENRLLHENRWDLCTLFDILYHPKRMTIEDLRTGMHRLTTRLYNEEATQARRAPFWAQFRHQAA